MRKRERGRERERERERQRERQRDRERKREREKEGEISLFLLTDAHTLIMFSTRQIAYGYVACNIRDISYHIIYKHIISYKNTSVFPYILSAMYVIFGILGFVSLLQNSCV